MRRDGAIDLLGSYEQATRTLRLAGAGFPLLGVGTHVAEGGLPWQLDEMAPDGFIAASFAARYPELGLPARRSMWSAADVLRVIALRGEDLAGNLIVGDESAARRDAPLTFDDVLRNVWDTMHALAGGRRPLPGSSVGGDRPKLLARRADGVDVIMKFSPPRSEPHGQRWSDLLRMEHHCAETLRGHVPAVTTRVHDDAGRTFLEVERFDRVPGGGRVGAVTWYHLGVGRYAEPSNVMEVALALHRDGFIDDDALARVELVHGFSAAIGNNDAHLGNYGLTIDDAGVVALAPFYDVLPMALAPRHDELADDRVAAFPAPLPEIAAWVLHDLVARVESDGAISRAFVDVWKSKLRPGR